MHPRVLLPYKKVKGQLQLDEVTGRFNYWHSLTGGVVEKCFGILKARFRWILKGVQMSDPQTYCGAFQVGCIVRISRGGGPFPPLGRHSVTAPTCIPLSLALGLARTHPCRSWVTLSGITPRVTQP